MSETDALLKPSPRSEINDVLGAVTIGVFAGGPFIFGLIPATLPVFTGHKIAQDPMMKNFDDVVVSHCLSFFWIGWAVASVTIVPMCDRLGRRTPMYVLLAIGMVAAWFTILATTSLSLALPIFFTGLTVPPAFQIGYLLLCESVPERFCPKITIFLNMGQSLVIIAMAGICEATRHMSWRSETLYWNAPFVFFLACGPWFVGESPRFSNASKVVGMSTADPESSGGIAHIIHQNGLLRRVVATTMCWMTCSLGFYGLSFVSGNLSDDLYENMMLMGVVDVVGYLVAVPIIAWVGPMRTQVISFFVAGLVLVACGLFKPGGALLGLALLGRLAIDVAFTTIYILLFETFPDECRSTAMGVANCFARGASFVTPLLTNLPTAVSCPLLGVLSFGAACATLDLQYRIQQEKSADLDG